MKKPRKRWVNRHTLATLEQKEGAIVLFALGKYKVVGIKGDKVFLEEIEKTHDRDAEVRN